MTDKDKEWVVIEGGAVQDRSAHITVFDLDDLQSGEMDWDSLDELAACAEAAGLFDVAEEYENERDRMGKAPDFFTN